MEWYQVVGFTLAVTPICLIPGTSFTLVTQKVVTGSRRDGVLVALGTATGLLVHAAFAAVGLSTLVMASSEALAVLRVLGAAYLVGLGITTWRSVRRGRPAAEGKPARQPRWRTPWAGLGSYGQGLWSNVLNPKASSVYLTLVPQFLSPGSPVAPQIGVLAVAHVLVVLTWLLTWTTAVAAAQRFVDTPCFRTALARTTGAVLVGLGLRTAAAR
ncbi:LysE family translocator [Yinghuangia soli]|uniref:LysE family translocator n=1 Tax=Yinghuangia soli TaxID=2908204 RepID=A0AA41PXQ0_9ACTN|nr:LysE family translocator [Yinghuangia soli]MCF2527621.1 LysE family translocator [Yinghuangia soli]